MDVRYPTWQPVLDAGKYKQVILALLVSEANNRSLGLTKLFKMLYYIDFNHFEFFNKPITGDIYIKQPFGPVPQTARGLLWEMEREGLITITQEPVFNFTRNVFGTRAKPEHDALDPHEWETIAGVIKKWSHHTTNEIVAATHGEVPWLAVGNWEEIPYGLAYYRHSAEISDPDWDEEESQPPWATER